MIEEGNYSSESLWCLLLENVGLLLSSRRKGMKLRAGVVGPGQRTKGLIHGNRQKIPTPDLTLFSGPGTLTVVSMSS